MYNTSSILNIYTFSFIYHPYHGLRSMKKKIIIIIIGEDKIAMNE